MRRRLADWAAVAALAVAVAACGGNPAGDSGTPSTPPAPWTDGSLVYDGAHADLVLFGGSPEAGAHTDGGTWTWDGRVWRLFHPAVAPAPRRQAVMAYDEGHREVLLYGGLVAAASGTGQEAAATDTWTWNGSTWKEQHPEHQPAISYDWPPTMAYDHASKTVVLYGFEKTTSASFTTMTSRTWSWDGSDWRLQPLAVGPSQTGQLVDAGGHAYLLAYAEGRVGGRYVTHMWRWDATRWTLLPATSDLAGLFNGSIAYDGARDRLVAFDRDTWTWDGAEWARQHTHVQPQAIGYMAYFARLHEIVVWGDRWLGSSNGLWAWDGSNWQQIDGGTVSPSPTPVGEYGPTTPVEAAAFVRDNMTSASPVLLPGWLPAALTEARVDVNAEGFSVDYESDQRDRSISFGIVVAQPPPGDASSTDAQVRFRNAETWKAGPRGYAEYFVYDGSAAGSDRWLMWIEPGTMSNSSLKAPGVPYFLYASGLTDAEFWQVANSLK